MNKSGLVLVYLLLIPMIFFLLGTFLTSQNILMYNSLSEYLPAIATLVAAFAGSYTAHLLEQRRQEKESDQTLLKSINLTILNYTNALNTLLNFKKNFIAPYKERDAPHLEIPPTAEIHTDVFEVNISSFASLYDKQSVLNLVAEIHSDIEGFKNLVYAINQRSEFHRKRYQPVQEQLEKVSTEEEAIRAIGKPIWFTLKQITENIIELTDVMIENLEKNANEIHETMSQYVLEPNKVIKFEYIEKNE